MGADVSPLYQIVQLATDLLPIAVTLGLVFLVLGLIFYMIGGGKLVNSLRIDKKMLYPMLAIMLFLAMAFGTAPAGATIALTLTTSQVYGGTVVTFQVTGLTVSTEYTIWFTGNSETINNVTFVANHATEYIPIGIPTDSDNAMTANLAASTAGVAASATATYYISLTDPGGFLQTGFFFNVLVPLIVIFLVVGILVGVKSGMIGGKNFSKK